MQNMWKLVGSPRHLLVFEAAARHGSFTNAARELNVSQPAISLCIRNLEKNLGTALFTRQHRAIQLTTAGERLYQDVAVGFGRILATAEELNTRSRRGHVTLSASSAFAHYWLVPRLASFHAIHPHIDLRVQISDREPEIGPDGISLAIRRGKGQWPGSATALIAEEALSPIVSPNYERGSPPLKDPHALMSEKLIHLEEPIRPRPTWRDWFTAFDAAFEDTGEGLRLNDYALVLQAAIAGEGYAMGWHHVTRRLVEQKLLLRLDQWTWRSGLGFYLVWPSGSPLADNLVAVQEWIIETANTESVAKS